jgi:hypothetical protein
VSLVDNFILWARKKAPFGRRVISHDDSNTLWFKRYEFMWPDEYRDDSGKLRSALPWWRPFNIFLHWWRPEPGAFEEMHDHPRWSITICLKGQVIERTPWKERHLRPGSIIIRGRKYIHSFSVPEGQSGKTWTLFIVGRRKHRQNTYLVTPR